MTAPPQQDPAAAATSAYAEHLARVNEQQAVRACNDVYSVHGVLIARQGSAIDYETARKIVRHKLTMPLDRNVELENELTAPNLFRKFEGLLAKFSDIRAAHAALDYAREFEQHATKLDLPPLIAQKLTVMAARTPALLEQTLVGAWMACLIARELSLDDKELPLVYLAAVCRDVGMLHIDPDLLDRPSTHMYGPDDWKALQSHVVASHMILKECDGIPERVLDAVIQHHENYDGTGYPSNWRNDELGLMGQILSLADTIVALRLKRFAGSGRNLRDAQAILHIDAEAYRPDVTSAAVRVLSRSGVQRTTFHPYETKPELIRNLRRRARAMMTCGGILSDMPSLAPADGKRRAPVILSALIERLTNVFARSGMADGEISRWLEHVGDGTEEAIMADLSELDLQQRELLWQFRRVQLNLLGFADRQGLRSRSPVRMIVERMRVFFEQLESGSPIEEVGAAAAVPAADEATDVELVSSADSSAKSATERGDVDLDVA